MHAWIAWMISSLRASLALMKQRKPVVAELSRRSLIKEFSLQKSKLYSRWSLGRSKLYSRYLHPPEKLRVSRYFAPFPLLCNVVQGLEEIATRTKTIMRLQTCAVNIAGMGVRGENEKTDPKFLRGGRVCWEEKEEDECVLTRAHILRTCEQATKR